MLPCPPPSGMQVCMPKSSALKRISLLQQFVCGWHSVSFLGFLFPACQLTGCQSSPSLPLHYHHEVCPPSSHPSPAQGAGVATPPPLIQAQPWSAPLLLLAPACQSTWSFAEYMQNVSTNGDRRHPWHTRLIFNNGAQCTYWTSSAASCTPH
jgi:hypothetical protein